MPTPYDQSWTIVAQYLSVPVGNGIGGLEQTQLPSFATDVPYGENAGEWGWYQTLAMMLAPLWGLTAGAGTFDTQEPNAVAGYTSGGIA
jgi:hypothetical protein